MPPPPGGAGAHSAVTTEHEIEARGVYWTRCTVGGRRMLFAVDQHGERVAECRVEAGADGDMLIDMLCRLLDAVDPRATPALRVVR